MLRLGLPLARRFVSSCSAHGGHPTTTPPRLRCCATTTNTHGDQDHSRSGPQQHRVADDRKVRNLVTILDGYFENNGHHINVNALTKEMLEDALEHPEKYPSLTIRVSGYAVLWQSLSADQRRDVISRTFHETF